MRNINLESYKIFYYVAKKGSFTGAAEALCISQPAVSQSIRLLEEALGGTLFIRTGKGVVLTYEGEKLLSYVGPGYESLLLGEEAFEKLKNYESGEIRIGASDMTLKYYLLPWLEQFHDTYPGIKVTVTNAPTPETIEYLKKGRIDFGAVSGPLEKEEGITALPVREISDIFVAGSKFFHLTRRTVDIKILEDMPAICLEKNTSTRKYIDSFLAENQVVLHPEFELATSDMIVQFAARNLGIGCVVADFAEKLMEEGRLAALKFNKKIPSRQICLVTAEKNPVSTAAKKLLELMENGNNISIDYGLHK